MVGLMQAAARFEPERDVRFSTYAVWWIRDAVQSAIMNQGRTVRVPVHVLRDLAKLEKGYLAGRGAFYMKALVDQSRRLRTLKAWTIDSTKFNGRLPWFKEAVFGVRYLLDRRHPRRQPPAPKPTLAGSR